jgi:hypothetical protein
MAGALLALAVPVATAATPGSSWDVYVAGAVFHDDQVQIEVDVVLGKFDGVQTSELSFYTASFQEITCKAKGRTPAAPGEIYTETSGVSEAAAIKIDRTLGTATASATLTVTEYVLNSCTGKETQRDLTKSLSFVLRATGGTTTTKVRFETTYPDGSRQLFTERYDVRDAGGTMTLGGKTYTAEFGTIGHDVFAETFYPPTHR